MSTKQLATLEEHLNTGAPNPNPPDTNQRILDEDTYVDTIQHIITRDFYPDLYTLNRQNQHIDQYGTPGNHVTPTPIKQYQKHKIKQKQNKNNNNNDDDDDDDNDNDNNNNNNNKQHEATPNETNEDIEDMEDDMDNMDDMEDEDLIHYVNGEMLSNEEKESMKHMNLKQFQNRYTSEDNYSFSEIMYKNQLEHFKKFPWIYQQQNDADQRKKYLSIMAKQQSFIHPENTNNSNNKNIIKAITASKAEENIKCITLPQDENGNNIINDNDKDKIMNNNKTKSQIVDEENEKKYREEEELQKKLDLYRGELAYWKFKAVNKLMFFPEGDTERNLKIMRKLHDEYGKPQCIYNNTRFPKTFELQNNNQPKLSEMERNLKGYSMINTPQIKPGNANDDNDDNDDNVEHIGTPITTWGELGGTPIALDANDRPIGPIFHIAKVPKRDKIVDVLNKKNTDKLRKKQEERLRNTTPRNEIYTPYSTKRILTPSGNHIDTPLVGLNTPSVNNKNNKNNNIKIKKRALSINRYHARSIDDLSPAARKLMERNMKHSNKLCTPLSSVLREQYSLTPNNVNYRKRKRNNNMDKETPSLIVGDTPSSKKRKFNDNVFKKPKYSLRDRNNNRRKKTNNNNKTKKSDSSNITDGLL